jgi:hypothetical protein
MSSKAEIFRMKNPIQMDQVRHSSNFDHLKSPKPSYRTRNLKKNSAVNQSVELPCTPFSNHSIAKILSGGEEDSPSEKNMEAERIMVKN